MPRAKLVFPLMALFFCAGIGLCQEAIARQQANARQQADARQEPDPRNIDASAFGERIDISQAWLYSPTDKAEYASPSFDDGSWQAISTTRRLETYGFRFREFSFCWYRVHVHLPSTARNVELAVQATRGQYQAFANGVQIAGPAAIHDSFGQYTPVTINYRIPDSAFERSRGDLVLAFRFASSRSNAQSEDPMQSARVYLVSADAAPRDTSYRATHNVATGLVKSAMLFLVSLVSIALYLAMRTHREYLAAAATLLLGAVFNFFYTLAYFTPSTYLYSVPLILIIAVLYVAQAEFVRLVLALPRTRLFLAAEVFLFLSTVSFIFNFFIPARHDTFIFLWFNAPTLTLDLLLLKLLIPACRQRNPDAYVLLPLMCVSFLDDFWNLYGAALGLLPHPIHLPDLPSVHIASYTIPFSDLDQFVFVSGMLLFLVLRTVRIARERARAAAEIEGAQSMQQLLLARSQEATPGFVVESIYLPASEVGGDFFLVSPNPADGSLTAIVGDVSGKGLKAAMRVAMVLGILRREESREPATILLRLNQALLSQGDVGFTTACCVRLKPDGSFTVANAGHISPYMNGAEFDTPPGLPLGLAADQDYAELSGHLAAGARMVLMSDGVVEARSKTGELYGFDRLKALSKRSAKSIAAAAQAFGQDDDITVLTLACTASS